MYLGLMEGAMSIGIGLGPILGSVLYELVGFVYLFVIIGAFHFAYIPVMMLVKPPDIDSDDQSAQSLVKNQSSLQQEQEISMSKLLSNRLVQLSSGSTFISCVAITYFEPVLSFRIAEFTNSVHIQGLLYGCFVAGSFTMSISISLVTKFIHPVKLLIMSVLL